MKYENFNMKEHGFVRHLAEPDGGSDRAVIVIMGESKAFSRGLSLQSGLQIMALQDLLFRYLAQRGFPMLRIRYRLICLYLPWNIFGAGKV